MTRKYNQRGYQNDDANHRTVRKHQDKPKHGPRQGYGPREPRKINMPGFREVLQCARCGTDVSEPINVDSQCQKCTSDLRSCAQCAWFDSGAQFECNQPVTVRVSPKDSRNDCKYFEGRVLVIRETHSTRQPNTKQAFDDLFK